MNLDADEVSASESESESIPSPSEQDAQNVHGQGHQQNPQQQALQSEYSNSHLAVINDCPTSESNDASARPIKKANGTSYIDTSLPLSTVSTCYNQTKVVTPSRVPASAPVTNTMTDWHSGSSQIIDKASTRSFPNHELSHFRHKKPFQPLPPLQTSMVSKPSLQDAIADAVKAVQEPSCVISADPGTGTDNDHHVNNWESEEEEEEEEEEEDDDDDDDESESESSVIKPAVSVSRNRKTLTNPQTKQRKSTIQSVVVIGK